MPACARKKVVDEDEVGVYHVWGRCVRRAFLCGKDPLTGKDYEHRRDWIRQTEEDFAGLFAVEVGFHTEMANHLHMVLRTRPDIVACWSDEEVVRRALAINLRTLNLVGKLVEPKENEIKIALRNPKCVAKYRKRLSSPSWFMKAVRENIARRANLADEVTGAFWDGRYRCRRLLDDASILICGMYVDLNQIRAGETSTPEASTHTSAFDRIRSQEFRQSAAASVLSAEEVERQVPDGWLSELTLDERHPQDASDLLRSRTGRRASDKGLVPGSRDWYLQLLDWSGRQIHAEKPGAIPADLAPILERLKIRGEHWIDLIKNYDRWFGSFAGHVDRLTQFASQIGRRLFRDGHPLETVFLSTASDS
jgi:hypothetical protein